jgi:hypothetical protein
VSWSRRRSRGAWVVLCVIASLVFAAGAARAAAAAPELVILLEPSDVSPAAAQSLRRIKDEVAADRFNVVVAAADTGTGAVPSTWGSGRGSLILLFGDPKTGRAELCVVSRTNTHTAVRRAVVVDAPEKMPEVLASRALELLRATALELSVDVSEAAAPPKQARPTPGGTQRATATAGASQESAPVSVDSGLVVIQSLKGPPPSLAPLLRVGLRLATWAELRTSVAGWGTRPRVETPYGSASVSQSFFLLDFATRLSARAALRPFASLGGGLLHVGISGEGVAPYVGQHGQQWSAAIDGGIGVALAFRSRAAAVVEVHCLVASPHPSIRFIDSVPATIGYPSLMLTLALQVLP